MGAYKRNQICKDFDIATKNLVCRNIIKIRYAAMKILEESPDNKYTDFAISHLLQAAQMLAIAHKLNQQGVDKDVVWRITPGEYGDDILSMWFEDEDGKIAIDRLVSLII